MKQLLKKNLVVVITIVGVQSNSVYWIRPYGAPLVQCEHKMAHTLYAFCSCFLSDKFNFLIISLKCVMIGPVIYPGGAANLKTQNQFFNLS